MKKFILFIFAVSIHSIIFAENTQPQIINGFRCDQMSANGKWMIGRSNTWEFEGDFYPESSICEVSTGKIFGLEDLFTITPFSRPISNSGVAVMSTYDEATDWYEVPYIIVPGEEPRMLKELYTSGPYSGCECYSVAIADDASCFLAYYEVYPKQYPFLCPINKDYTIGEPDFLPLPPQDIFGEEPFSVMLTCLSGDCKTVAGTVMTFDGKIAYPVVYNKKEGEWSYSMPTVRLFDPDYPEKFPNFYPYQIALSPDGTKLACTQAMPGKIPDFDDYIVWVFDLTTGDYNIIESSNPDIIATQILDDGTIVGTFFASIKISYIRTTDSPDFIDFMEYMKELNTGYAKWMEDNLLVKVIDIDENGNQVEKYLPDTGQIFVSYNLDTFGAGLLTGEYDDFYNPLMYSYVFSDLNQSGVDEIIYEPSERNNNIIYDFQGNKVMTVSDINEIRSLAKGLYIVNGKKIAIR